MPFHICVPKSELAAVLGRSQENIGVIELAADLLGNQPGLPHRLKRAQRARMPKSAMPRAMSELKSLGQPVDVACGTIVPSRRRY